jgi:hypothetical protein
VLGALAGVSVGFNAPSIARGDADARRDALFALGVTGAAVGASLSWKKHPAWGYLLGGAAASLLTLYVPGSPMQRMAIELEQQRLADEQAKRLGLPASRAAA